MWDEHFFSSIDLTHLIPTLTAVSDLNSFGQLFFPKSRAKENCVSKIRLRKATFRPVPQEMQKYVMKIIPLGEAAPLFHPFLQNTSITTTKRHMGNLFPLRVRSLPSLKGCLLLLVTDITQTFLTPYAAHSPTCKLEIEERGVSKLWNLLLPGGISLFLSNFSK